MVLEQISTRLKGMGIRIGDRLKICDSLRNTKDNVFSLSLSTNCAHTCFEGIVTFFYTQSVNRLYPTVIFQEHRLSLQIQETR